MKILFIHQNFPAQFVHLAPAMATQGAEVVALSTRRGAPALPGVKLLNSAIPAPPKGRLQFMDAAEREWDAKLSRGLATAEALRRLSAQGFVPDVVMAHPGWGEALFVKDVLPKARLGIYGEFYYAAHGRDTDFDPEFRAEERDLALRLRLKNTALLYALAAADAVVSPTQYQRSCHPADFLPKIKVIHDGIDTARCCPDASATVRFDKLGLSLNAGDEVITFVARGLEPYRGYHILMRALPAILAARPQARVVIVGEDKVCYGKATADGSSWKLRFFDEVKAQLDPRRVHFVGRVPHALLTRLMQVSAVHIYLTYPFVLSWSLLEAMSIGCLVVGSRTAPVEEVIEHCKNGLLVDFFDVAELSRTVIAALAEPERFRALRVAARQTIIDQFDLRSICLPGQCRFVEWLGQR